jgi:pimeloyl-ACP methyl ester carboxylesterase
MTALRLPAEASRSFPGAPDYSHRVYLPGIVRRMRRRMALMLALTLAVTAAFPATSAGAAGGVQRLVWTPCAEAPDDPAVRCATLRVPVDWSRPHGATFELALARRLASDPAARIGTLVYGPGGPGGSGVDVVLNGLRFSEEVHRRFDFVSFDPRGVGRSHPVLCTPELLDQVPFPEPRNQSEFDRIVAFNQRLRADCRALTGPLFDHVDTLSMAHDVDAMRAALGEARITFYGGSYGTVLGAQYAERYPHRLRALVLDSILDHSLGTKGLLDAGAISLQDSLDEFVAWCDGEPSCALHGRDVRASVATIFGKIERGEVIIEPGDPPLLARPFDFILGMTDTLSSGAETWPFIADFLLSLDMGSPQARATPRTMGVPFPGRAIRCADFYMPMRDFNDYSRSLRRGEKITPDLRYSADRMDQVIRCLGTPNPIANPQHELRIHNLTTPALLVNNRHDPITGYTMAVNVARQFGRHGRLFTADGWGHAVYGECVNRTLDRYFISLELPAPGGRCPGEPTPAQAANQSLASSSSAAG